MVQNTYKAHAGGRALSAVRILSNYPLNCSFMCTTLLCAVGMSATANRLKHYLAVSCEHLGGNKYLALITDLHLTAQPKHHTQALDTQQFQGLSNLLHSFLK